MLHTFKTAGRIWASSLRFTIRSPRILFLSYLFGIAVTYVSEAAGDIFTGEEPLFDESIVAYVVFGITGAILAACFAAFQLYGMRDALRFATGRAESWSFWVWCKRTLDFLLGYSVYIGLALLMGVVIGALLADPVVDAVRRLQGDSASPFLWDVSTLSKYVACAVFASVALFFIVRISLWLPMAAFRRGDQWSPILAWTHSRSKGLLIFSTLVLLELVAFGLMTAGEHLVGLADVFRSMLIEANVPGWITMGDEFEFLANLTERLLLAGVFCAFFAIRTSVAANLLGIKSRSESEEYFSYTMRSTRD